jgi:hypothetical protein
MVAVEIIIMVALPILANGYLAMCELAIASSTHTRRHIFGEHGGKRRGRYSYAVEIDHEQEDPKR